LIKLWIFGDKHQIPLLQNDAIDAMLDKVNRGAQVPVHWMTYAYENTTSKSHLRKALVDFIAYRALISDDTGVSAFFSDGTELWSMQVSLDIMVEMERGWSNHASRAYLPAREKCYYHVHAGTEHC
jgi:hypothetical protein